METLIYPDYTSSNLNFIASVMRHFGMETNVPPLSNLPVGSFQKKHLIVLILDGFGTNLFSEISLPFLRRHQINTLTAPFPSTTTAAIPSLLTGKYPLEHGALGWSLFFKELACLIDYLPGKNHVTEEKLETEKFPIYQLIDFDSMFLNMQKINPGLDLHYYVPKHIFKSKFTKKMGLGATIHSAASLAKMLVQIEKTMQKAEKPTFHYCYFTKPDSLEHKFGVFSPEVKNFMKKTDVELALFQGKIKTSNCEMFITADHGLIDVEEYIRINDYPALKDAMLYPLFPEGRFVSFFLKPHKKEIFRQTIKQFEKDFLILSREEFFKKKLLGYGNPHPKIDDFIGDFCAIATGKKAFLSTYPSRKKETLLKAHHCGLTSAEMQVPLIRLSQ